MKKGKRCLIGSGIVLLIILTGCFGVFRRATIVDAFIVFKDTTKFQNIVSILEGLDLTILEELSIIHGVSCRLSEGLLDDIGNLASISYVEKSIDVYLVDNMIPGVISPGAMETPIESAVTWNMRLIGADKIWDVNQGIGVRVGVLDTGIDSDHIDFMQDGVSSVASGYNAITGGSTEDDHGHGTSVASIIGARRNGVGIIGVFTRPLTVATLGVLLL